ncbi:adenylate kinase [Stackebrandtia soli]|uniref:adenylate kinase n=1 Tax=Stackebrandtia soli TaxID=1892856 RepID=UPI0039E8ED32
MKASRKVATQIADRVMVVGCSGAGKSTLAVELGRRYELPVVHLDAHYWRPGWVRPSDEEWAATVGELVENPRWIHDGNYNATLPVRLPRAELVVFVDLARWRCLWRITRRRLAGAMIHDLPGCRERFDLDFYRYVWRFPRHSRNRLLDNLNRHLPPGVRLVRLRSPRQVRGFLRSLSAN